MWVLVDKAVCLERDVTTHTKRKLTKVSFELYSLPEENKQPL
jgi:hypothetical protein